VKPTLNSNSGDETRLIAAEAADLATANVSIQPHGVLLAVNAGDLTVSHVSQNAEASLGVSVDDLLGSDLASLLGSDWVEENKSTLDGSELHRHSIAATLLGRTFDVIVHRSEAFVVLELEPSVVTPGHEETLAVYRAIQQLTRATTDLEMWDAAAAAFQELTDFDRVIVYAFLPDGQGEIVAESAPGDTERYLGLHFPASNLPEHVRRSYLTRRSRLIVSSDAESSLVIAGGESGPLDLSGAELTSVSAHDLYFMNTFGHASLLSLSLVRGGELIGVISLANRTPVTVPYSIRRGLEAMANQVALHLDSMMKIRRLTDAKRIRSIRTELIDQLVLQRSTDASAIADALFGGELTVLDLIAADGAMICLGTHVTSIGAAPRPSVVRAAGLQLGAALAGRSIVSESLVEEHPDVALLLPSVSGLIVTPLPGFDGFLAWFRMETPDRTDWFGVDPSVEVLPGAVGGAFPSWSKTVMGRSTPWTGLESEADDLARDLTLALLRQADTQLAALAMRDALTGLPNRRLLMDRIELGLAREIEPSEPTRLTVLFVDIDSFKAVNDTYGHDAGDTLLVQVANRILATTRTPDTVARLGGDEFVVLCDGITEQEAAVIADRIAEAIRQPIDVGGSLVTVTASVGMAVADPASTAADVLKRADGAMYRAKAQGKDRVAV
jgi:chemotaxis family two-component system sensor kinase Cph1